MTVHSEASDTIPLCATFSRHDKAKNLVMAIAVNRNQQ